MLRGLYTLGRFFLSLYTKWIKFEPVHEKGTLWFSGVFFVCFSFFFFFFFKCVYAVLHLGYRHAFSALNCLKVSTTCLRTAKALVRLRLCAGYPELFPVAYPISTLFPVRWLICDFLLAFMHPKHFYFWKVDFCKRKDDLL